MWAGAEGCKDCIMREIRGSMLSASRCSSLRRNMNAPVPTRMMCCHEAWNAKFSAFALQQTVALMSRCSHEVAASG